MPTPAPQYSLDFGIKNSLIKFANQSVADLEYVNYFTQILIEDLRISSVHQFVLIDITSAIILSPLVLYLDKNIIDVNISGIEIDNVSIIGGYNVLFDISSIGTLNIQNVMVSNFNINNYKEDPNEFSYVPQNGAVFRILAIGKEL